MKTADNILFEHISKDICVGFETGIVASIIEAMKEYATEYAKEVQRLCAESAETDSKHPNCGVEVDKQSILSETNLPSHE